jgi:hypothetical protein
VGFGGLSCPLRRVHQLCASGLRPNEERVVSELERLSKDDGPGEYFGRFDYLCFDSGGLVRTEFAEAAARKNFQVPRSLATGCGTDRSCCNLNSDVTGIVGLVEGDAIWCVELKKANSAFLTVPARPIWIKPSELIVRRDTFATSMHIPGRPWRSMPGQFYYLLMEK